MKSTDIDPRCWWTLKDGEPFAMTPMDYHEYEERLCPRLKIIESYTRTHKIYTFLRPYNPGGPEFQHAIYDREDEFLKKETTYARSTQEAMDAHYRVVKQLFLEDKEHD